MTRVLMTADAIGGVWQYATELAHGLTARGLHMDLAVLGPMPGDEQRAALPVEVALLDTGRAPDWLAPDAAAVEASAEVVARLAHDRGADLVHLNHPALAAADYAMPVVAVLHSCVASWWEAVEGGDLPHAFAWQTALTGRGLRRSDVVACPSRAFAATTQRLYDLHATPVAIHNGRRRPSTTDTMEDTVFTAGRLWDRGKNVATLDAAAASLALPFLAAGATQGPNGDRIVPSHLRLLGRVGDETIAGCLAHRPIFASAALYEPFGLAVLEAALAGCALVLSDIPTFRELWDGVADFVAPTDARGFAAAIDRIVGDPHLRRDRGQQASDRAMSCAPQAMVDDVMRLYDRVLPRAAAALPGSIAA